MTSIKCSAHQYVIIATQDSLSLFSVRKTIKDNNMFCFTAPATGSWPCTATSQPHQAQVHLQPILFYTSQKVNTPETDVMPETQENEDSLQIVHISWHFCSLCWVHPDWALLKLTPKDPSYAAVCSRAVDVILAPWCWGGQKLRMLWHISSPGESFSNSDVWNAQKKIWLYLSKIQLRNCCHRGRASQASFTILWFHDYTKKVKTPLHKTGLSEKLSISIWCVAWLMSPALTRCARSWFHLPHVPKTRKILESKLQQIIVVTFITAECAHHPCSGWMWGVLIF